MNLDSPDFSIKEIFVPLGSLSSLAPNRSRRKVNLPCQYTDKLDVGEKPSISKNGDKKPICLHSNTLSVEHDVFFRSGAIIAIPFHDVRPEIINSHCTEKPLNILLVDDDISSIVALTNLLEHEHSLRIASNGLDAIQAFRIARFDVVITDIRMPKMDGIGLLKAIRKHNRYAEVIILTGYPSPDNIKDAEKYGVSAFFTKPLDVEQFMDALSRIHECQCGK